jgi:hypothetical protein
MAEAFDNVTCPCLPVDGSNVPVTVGTVTENINFTLEAAPFVVSGQVTSSATGAPISGIEVRIEDSDLIRAQADFSLNVAGREITDDQGRYQFSVPAGNYVVQTISGDQGFVDEYFDDVPASTLIEEAAPLVVAADVDNVDFALDSGSRIQGTVTRSADDSPVNGFLIVAVRQGDFELFASETGPDGVYTISGISAGTYKVFAFSGAGFNLINEVFDNIQCGSCEGFSEEQTAGTPVAVAEGQTVSGIDFALDTGAGISGKVTAQESGENLPGVLMFFADQNGESFAQAQVDANGEYIIQGLPPGSYTVRTTRAGSFSLVNEIWDNEACIGDCDSNLGQLISLEAGDLVQGIDFSLQPVSRLAEELASEQSELGKAVAISDDKLVIGAPGDDTMGEDAGAALVVAISDGKFEFLQLLFAMNPEAGAFFGSALAIENGVLVVGAPGSPPDGKGTGGTEGSANVFQTNANGFLAGSQQLNAINMLSASGTAFGSAVAIQSGLIAVGAPKAQKMDDDDAGPATGTASGAVALFGQSQGEWIPSVVLTPAQGESGDQFGASVDIDNDQVAVGSPMSQDESDQAVGSASIFQRDPEGLKGSGSLWPLVALLQSGNPAQGDLFGAALSLKAGVLVAGVPGNDEVAQDAGAAIVFTSESGVFEQSHTILPIVDDAGGDGKADNSGAGSVNGQFGAALQSANGQVAIGAPGETGTTANAGAAYVFAPPSPNDPKYQMLDRLLSSIGQSGSALGTSIAFNGSTLAVGQPTANDSGSVLAATGSPRKSIDSTISGAWFNADQSGHGWLIEVLQGPEDGTPVSINAYWYVYQDGNPVWLLGGGQLEGSSVTLDMIIASGPTFPPDYDVNDLQIDPWGTLTFDFATETTGTASWSSTVGDFGSGSLDISRLAPISSGPDGCNSGTFFDPAQNGHGFVAQVVNIGGVDNLLLAWFVYLDGEQVWMLGIGPITNGVADVPLEIFSGGDFPPNFSAGDVVNDPWGSILVTFAGDDTATASWITNSPGFTDGNIELIRLTTLDGFDCP